MSLKVYDVLGREIATLVNEVRQPGEYTVKWDPSTSSGQGIASGVYFYRLQAGDPSASSGRGFTDIKKMLLLK